MAIVGLRSFTKEEGKAFFKENPELVPEPDIQETCYRKSRKGTEVCTLRAGHASPHVQHQWFGDSPASKEGKNYIVLLWLLTSD